MTIDYGWVSESLQATADKRDEQIRSLLGINLKELNRLRHVFAGASASGADEARVTQRVGLSRKMFHWWRRLEAMADDALEAEVERFRGLVEQEQAKRAPSTTAAARSRNQRLGKPYVGAARVRPRVYVSGPVPGWWHGGE